MKAFSIVFLALSLVVMGCAPKKDTSRGKVSVREARTSGNNLGGDTIQPGNGGSTTDPVPPGGAFQRKNANLIYSSKQNVEALASATMDPAVDMDSSFLSIAVSGEVQISENSQNIFALVP